MEVFPIVETTTLKLVNIVAHKLKVLPESVYFYSRTGFIEII